MRLWLVLVGLVLVVVGLLAGELGPVSWIPFLGGIVCIGVGLIVDSRAKAAAKARGKARSRGY